MFSTKTETILPEIEHIAKWARTNNLILNDLKTTEMIVSRSRVKPNDLPAELEGIQRKQQIKVLGITFTSKLNFEPHITNLTQSSAQSMYALRVLKAHGMPEEALKLVAQSTVVARMRYASQAWRGFLDCASITALNGVFKKMQRQGLLPRDSPDIMQFFDTDDTTLFNTIIANPTHVLYHLLPPTQTSQYSMRKRAHNFTLPKQHALLKPKNFISRMLFKDAY